MTERQGPPAERGGEVYDLGYQHYDGPREGRSRARMAVFENGVRSVLGIGRGARAKILPILLLISAILPALIFVLIASTAEPLAEFLPGAADYYRVISIVLLIFSAIMAPELLAPDRRENVLSLYLVRPLTPTDYVVARFMAFFVIVLGLVYAGQIILQVGLVLVASDPLEYLKDNWLDIPRFLAAGVLVALFITVVPLFVAALTTRRAYAAAFIIGLFFISTGIADGLTSPEVVCREVVTDNGRGTTCETGDPVTGEAAKWFALISMRDVPLRMNDMIFEADDEGPPSLLAAAELEAWAPIGVYVLLTLVPGFVLWRRYQAIRI